MHDSYMANYSSHCMRSNSELPKYFDISRQQISQEISLFKIYLNSAIVFFFQKSQIQYLHMVKIDDRTNKNAKQT